MFVELVAFGAGGALWFVGRWLGGLFSSTAATWGGWIGVGLCIAAYLTFLISYITFRRTSRRRVWREIGSSEVQEIEVEGARVIGIIPINDREPILAFDIGKGKVLAMQGPWLYDPRTYGAPLAEDEGDSLDDLVNGLAPPYSFPSGAFTLTRLPQSGLVIGIRVKGDYLDPGPFVEAWGIEYRFGDSELMEGKLSEIAHVLALEHARREANGNVGA
jgi:hypothetical protein